MEFNITVLIALSALMLLCVCLVAQGCVQAELGMLFLASIMTPESGLFEEWPLDLPKIDALDLRRCSEFERFLDARRKDRELVRSGELEPFPSGWYAVC